MVNVKMRSLFPNDIGRELLKDLRPKRWLKMNQIMKIGLKIRKNEKIFVTSMTDIASDNVLISQWPPLNFFLPIFLNHIFKFIVDG
jgi:hypothetical protein